MKKASLLLIAAVFSIVACGGGEQVKSPNVQSAGPQVVKVQNDQLAKIPVTGFAYKGSSVPAQSWDKWAKAAAPAVREIINNLPEGYVLEVQGHSDARGPEAAEKGKPGNIAISQQRADAVLASLRKEGITSPKIRAKGYGSSQTLSGVDDKDAAQRRVTFKVVEK